ncbi:alpha/beta fold hydrolase [Streptomyces purpurascens]
MDIRRRNNVNVIGRDDSPVLVLAHGFGCDQNMWRLVVPVLAERYRVVLFDYVGSGGSDLSAWSEERYSSLQGYASDVVDVCEELDLRQAVFVGHSVSAMVGVLAAQAAPEQIGAARDGDALALLHRRRGVPRRLQHRGHRRAAGLPGGELPGLVVRDGPGDHG